MSSEITGITRANEGIQGISWNILGQTYVPKSKTEHSFSWHATLPPGTFVPPHIHPDQDEYLYMLEGKLDFMLGNSESHAGGRLRVTILGDACEALIGAVYLDGGYPAAEKLVARFWKERMAKPLRSLRDPKTMLQEWAQARGLPTPDYRELARTGPHHNPKFRVAVALPDRPPAEGLGLSKRAAEQAAAAAMLERVGVKLDKANA